DDVHVRDLAREHLAEHDPHRLVVLGDQRDLLAELVRVEYGPAERPLPELVQDRLHEASGGLVVGRGGVADVQSTEASALAFMCATAEIVIIGFTPEAVGK